MRNINAKRLLTVLPAVAMTAVSMVLTLAVVVMWLGESMPKGVALVVGLGIDGGWLATLAYERRLAAQGDHSNAVTGVGWGFGAVASGVLVTHALLADETSQGAWLAVAWLPVAAKALWLVHGLWERTALTPAALDLIRGIQQDARDDAAVARARLRAEASTEETRLTAVTEAGARVARVQARTADTLADAWSKLETARKGESTGRALNSVTARVTPDVTPSWELPVWGPSETVAALESGPALTDDALDVVVDAIRLSEQPPLSYREMATRFRAAGHSASEVRLRASWKRVA
ncbi:MULTISPECIES: protein spdB [unclassified Streptomyces]|uniref:protein spdB n=1 Tax=unclassified Streptomyces TaxID=2593676 RepID=UPI0037FE5D2D